MSPQDASRRRGGPRSEGSGISDEQLARYGSVVAPVVVVLACVVAWVTYGPAVGVLILAGGMLLAVIVSFWNSIRALFGDTALTGEDAFALGAPSAEQEQKRAVLRAIKDLDFERTVGKISQEDYEVLMARYRADAKQLLRLIDDLAAPGRAKVEKLVEQHLADLNLDQPLEEDEATDEVEGDSDSDPDESETEDDDDSEDDDEDDDSEDEDDDDSEGETEDDDDDEEEQLKVCPSCETSNDVDAVFCKKCATRLTEEVDS